MNPNQRWVDGTTATAPVPPSLTPNIPSPAPSQYPGESLYLPQPDYGAHPAMQATLPGPNRSHHRLLAALTVVLFVAIVAAVSAVAFRHPKLHVALHKAPAAPVHAAVSVPKVTRPTRIDPDTERHQDLQAMHTSLEAYSAKVGHYPTLSQLNSSDWLEANMPDVKQAALADPTGSSPSLTSTPLPNQYAYQAYASDGHTSCDDVAVNCQSYLLTATLSNGTVFTLRSGA